MKNFKRFAVLTMAGILSFANVCMADAISGNAEVQIEAALALAESGYEDNELAIKLLLEEALSLAAADTELSDTLSQILQLLESDAVDADSMTTLLRLLVEQIKKGEETSGQENVEPVTSEEEPTAPEPETEEETTAPAEPETEMEREEEAETTTRGTYVSPYNLPIYDGAVYIYKFLPENVVSEVPGNWGNNESGRSLTSYSPVNDSGAISPAAGTISVSYFPLDGMSVEETLDAFQESIETMSVTTLKGAADTYVAGLNARIVEYTMSVGANQFQCESICFTYEGMAYTLELMQGAQTEYDFFPTYYHVVDSTLLASEEEIQELKGEEEDIRETEEGPESQEEDPKPEPEPEPEPETPKEEFDYSGSLDSFTYAIGSHIYQFPTNVTEIDQNDLQLERELVLPYDYRSDADMVAGQWTELTNTHYYYYQNAFHKEMVGVTNLTGAPISLSEGVLTALIDTAGDFVQLNLPGNIQVGGAETDILNGFPEFAETQLDGLAYFKENELLYARNVRADGCNGYVLIRNDAPYYSALSIICENGSIKEISFECLGKVRAQGIFLD